jgi:hypothetical protein
VSIRARPGRATARLSDLGHTTGHRSADQVPCAVPERRGQPRRNRYLRPSRRGVSGGPVQANAPRASGDGGMEALRVLKRRLSDVYRALQADAASPDIKIAA